MQITPYQWNTQVSGISAINTSQLNLSSSQYSAQTTTIGEDEMTISNQGRQMAMRMQRMREMDPADIEEQATQMKTAVAELELEDLDLSDMSSEALQAKAEEIHATMNELRPEGMPERQVEFTGMSDEELTGMIEDFSDRASEMISRVDMMEDVAGGGMPPMGRGGGGGGMKGMGGGRGMGGMQAMGGTEETEEDEETSLIETILAALEEESEDDETNGLTTAFYSFMERQGII